MNEIGQRTAVTTEGSAFTGSPADGSWRYYSLGQLEKSAPGTIGDKNRSHQYDHPSRLVPRSLDVPPTSATRYLYDGWNPIAKYDPFGTLTRLTGDNSTLFQYRFSTKPIDPATGLYYYGYRWYDPLTGSGILSLA